MKLNILFNNPDDVLSGYVNIDPTAFPTDTTRVASVFSPIPDSICCDGEAVEIIAHEILEVVGGDTDQLLRSWVKKLAHGGQIVLSFSDLMEVAKATVSRQLTIEEAERLLVGTPDKRKLRLFDLTFMCQKLESMELRIIKRRTQDYRSVVVAQRQ